MLTTSCDGTSSFGVRIVVTGLGVVSPLGSEIDTFWRRLAAAGSEREIAAGSASAEKTAEFTGQLADFGELPPAVRKQLAKSLKVMNRETQLGVAAGLQALRDGDLAGVYLPEQIGIAFAAGNACIAPEDFREGVQACRDDRGGVDVSAWGAQGLPEMAPLWLLRCLPNMAACHLAILADIQGPSNTITQHSLGVDLAVAEACRILRSGDAQAMLVGGAGTTLEGLNRLHAVWADPDHPAGDLPAEGSISQTLFPSEGAAALVLETLDSARRRGAHIYGEVRACVSLSRGRSSASESPLNAVALEALGRSHLTWDDIGHVHLPDLNCADGLKVGAASLPEHATALGRRIPAVSGRVHWGDAGAGSSAIELVASLLALSHGELFGSTSTGECHAGRTRRPATIGGEPSGEKSLKFSHHGQRQATCVALARIPA